MPTDSRTEIRALTKCVKALRTVDQETAARMVAYLHDRFVVNWQEPPAARVGETPPR